jgi:LPXTG-motif cell wall-anchored protein
MFKTIAAFFSVVFMALVFLFVGTTAASAHTPAIQITCDGVKLHATNYDGNAVNTWSVAINGEVVDGTFGASLDKVIPVPQGGAITDAGAQISDANKTPAYSTSYVTTVGPCGEKPPVVVVPGKPNVIVTTDIVKECLPEVQKINIYETITTTDWVLVDNVWVKGTPVVVTNMYHRDVEIGECPEAVTPPTTQPPVTTPETPVDTPSEPQTPTDTVSEKPVDSPTPAATPVSDVITLAAATTPTSEVEKTVATKAPLLASTGYESGDIFALGIGIVLVGLSLYGIYYFRKVRSAPEQIVEDEKVESK